MLFSTSLKSVSVSRVLVSLSAEGVALSHVNNLTIQFHHMTGLDSFHSIIQPNSLRNNLNERC